MTVGREIVAALQAARRAEKAQSLFYRSLAAAAADAQDTDAVERLNGLHADEQHHLSRLSARLVELGEPLDDVTGTPPPPADFGTWETDARGRELDEISRYRALLRLSLDGRTAIMVQEFLETEHSHATALGGKWMPA